MTNVLRTFMWAKAQDPVTAKLSSSTMVYAVRAERLQTD